MTRSAVFSESGIAGAGEFRPPRPLRAACAAAALLLGLVLAASPAVGGVGQPVGGWVLVCCLLGAGLEGVALRSVRRHRGVAIAVVAGVAVVLAGAAAIWPLGVGVLAASIAVTSVPVDLAGAFTPAGSVEVGGVVVGGVVEGGTAAGRALEGGARVACADWPRMHLIPGRMS